MTVPEWYKFEPTISLGTILTGVTIVLLLLAAWIKFSNRLAVIETMLQPIWEWWNKYTVDSQGKLQKTTADEKIEHAVRNAVQSAVREVLEQDRKYRGGVRP